MKQDLESLDFKEGAVLLFNKPLDWTSFDVVNRIRKTICVKLGVKKLKVGHAGTLDPKATGLVILCTGKATKSIESIQAEEKEYIAKVKFGATTPSSDLETNEDQFFPTEHIAIENIKEVLKSFIGETDQVPPVFSAIRIKGKRAFNYARSGQEVEMKSRKIKIFNIEILEFTMPYLIIKVNCGKGTYIRSLARDIGEKLNSGSYLVGLERTKIGENSLIDAWEVEDFKKKLLDM